MELYNDLPKYRLRTHIISALVLHLIFGLPAFILLIVLRQFSLVVSTFWFVFSLVSSPIAGVITWLIDKGSRGENATAAIKALGILPSRLYGLLVGGMVGNYLGGTVGMLLGGVLIYLLGRYFGFRFVSSLSVKLASSMS